MSKKLILLCIFLLALLLRTINLGNLPRGFYEEEVTNAYVGRFILQNGKDLYGNILPLLYFNKFNDYPPVLPMYLSGLPTFIFGPTVFAARFVTALIGALTVFPVAAIGYLLFSDVAVSLFAALFLAILPWHVVLSRTGAEGVMGLAAYAYAVELVLRGMKEKDGKFIKQSFIFFFLCYFLYPALRILVPLTLIPFSFLTGGGKKHLKKTLLVGTGLFFILTLVISMTVWGKGRFEQTSIFRNKEINDRIAFNNRLFSSGEGADNVLLARIFHNKAVGFTRELANQYFSYFSPSHLFLKAGGQPRYYNVPEQGLLLMIMAPLFLCALVPLLKKTNVPFLGYLVFLLAIAPIPAVLTIDFVPHAHRSMFMILPLVVLAAYGLGNLGAFLPRWIPTYLIILLLLAGESMYALHQYTRHSDAQQSVLRNDGDKEIARYVRDHEKEYDRVIMPMFARLPLYYLYLSNNFDGKLAGRFRNEIKIDQIGKITFATDWCPTKVINREDISPNTLIIENGDCESRPGYKTIDSSLRSDSTRAYTVLVRSDATVH